MADATKTESYTEIFLSPRVVDRGAFDDYSSRLRGMIAEATGEARRLGDAALAATAARDDLRAATGRTTEQAQQAVELSRALGARITSLENSLARASRLAESVQKLEDRVRAALDSFAAREATIAALVAKIDSVNLASAIADAETAAIRFTEIKQSAESATERLTRSLDGAVEFTDRLIGQHDTMRGEASAGIEALREASRVRETVMRDLQMVAESVGRIASGARADAAIGPSPQPIGAG